MAQARTSDGVGSGADGAVSSFWGAGTEAVNGVGFGAGPDVGGGGDEGEESPDSILSGNQGPSIARPMVVRNVWTMVVLALVALVAGCSDGEGVVDGPASADIDGDVPYGPGVVAGETYDYRLYTHCGIEWTRIDGVWWRATIPLDDGSANPPSGWGNPYDEGELAVLDEATAVYRGGPSAEVEFERTDHVDAPFACD